MVLAYDFLYIDLCSAALYYVALFFSVSIIYFHVQCMYAHIYSIFDALYPYIGTGIGRDCGPSRYSSTEAIAAVTRQVVRKTHAGVGRQGYTVQQCAVTVMDKHAATLMHYLLVQIQTMTHRCVWCECDSVAYIINYSVSSYI